MSAQKAGAVPSGRLGGMGSLVTCHLCGESFGWPMEQPLPKRCPECGGNGDTQPTEPPEKP